MAIIPASTVRAAAETIRVLVSPMLYPLATDWRRAVHDAMRALFRADQAMTIMPGGGELFQSEDLDPPVLAALRGWFSGFTPDGRIDTTDPVLNRWNDRRRRLGLRVYTRDIIDHVIRGQVLASPFVREALLPNRMRYWQGVYGTGPGNSDALLWVSHARTDTAPTDESTTALLEMLAPAFQAGLSALNRLDTARAALDAAASPLMVFDAQGSELHRSPGLDALLGQDPAASTVVSRGGELARQALTGLAPGPRGTPCPAPVATEAVTPGGRYGIRVTLLPEGAFGAGQAAVVLVSPRAPAVLPDAAVIQAAYGLTAREAEVALHLATGATRNDIARALRISPHTVRAHTENVFLKLGVTTRAAVPLALQRAGLPHP